MKKTLIIITSLIIGIAIGLTIKEFLPTNHSYPVKKEKISSIHKVSTTTAQEEAPIIKISQNRALKDFHRLYPNAKVTEIKLTIQYQSYIYDIVGYDTKKDCTIKINASTGEILGQSTLRNEDQEADTEEDTLQINKLVSRKEASQIAIQKVDGGEAREWTLAVTPSHTNPIWTVKIVDHNEVTKVKIDALSKDIINN